MATSNESKLGIVRRISDKITKYKILDATAKAVLEYHTLKINNK